MEYNTNDAENSVQKEWAKAVVNRQQASWKETSGRIWQNLKTEQAVSLDSEVQKKNIHKGARTRTISQIIGVVLRV